ncbi:hypothetical protein L873DRAFT_1010954 [Choiromyces venosus 120613-1]|uniref:Uncharacterized protein n=1 Tax=Choiromyces venosus 120613-1 TaxID=1336337 RepID=A0A3N4JP67_9PEZI|nr:hypothetical protein L873DRAFT_1010954 [Choiromyces venosus 120613-1]
MPFCNLIFILNFLCLTISFSLSALSFWLLSLVSFSVLSFVPSLSTRLCCSLSFPLCLGLSFLSTIATENSQVPHKAAPVTCPNPETNLTKKQKSWHLSPSYNRGSTTQL